MRVTMIRTQIQLNEDLVKELKKIANLCDISIAELIRQCIRQHLKMIFVTNKEEQWKRASLLLGKFTTPDDDISERHDDYLKGAFK